jgi:2-dehydropantoate 2-reductase
MPPGELLADPNLFAIEVAALRETAGVMQILGIHAVDLPGAPALQLLQAIRWLPTFILQPILRSRIARGRGQKPPSLLLSLRSGRSETEVIWLNGAVAQAASNIDRLAPINHALALLVIDIASGRVSWNTYRKKPEMLIRAIRMAQDMPR